MSDFGLRIGIEGERDFWASRERAIEHATSLFY